MSKANLIAIAIAAVAAMAVLYLYNQGQLAFLAPKPVEPTGAAPTK